MALFKSKEERKQKRDEMQQKLFNQFLEDKNLNQLTQEDKEYANEVRENIEYTTKYSVKGTEAEISQLEMMMAIIDQNWLIIKLLNEMKDKLDKADK